MTNKEEYLMLREEINKIYDMIEKTRNLLYVTMAAIFTFSATQKNPYLFLLPYAIIIPCYIITIDNQIGMWRIGTYLAVFLEGEDFNWERRLYKFNIRTGNMFVRSYDMPYILTSIASAFLFLINCNYSDIGLNTDTFSIILGIMLLVGFLLYIRTQTPPERVKDRMVKEWMQLKDHQNELSSEFDHTNTQN